MGQEIDVQGGTWGRCRDTFSPKAYEIAVCKDAFTGAVTCHGLGSDPDTGLEQWYPLDDTDPLCTGAKAALAEQVDRERG